MNLGLSPITEQIETTPTFRRYHSGEIFNQGIYLHENDNPQAEITILSWGRYYLSSDRKPMYHVLIKGAIHVFDTLHTYEHWTQQGTETFFAELGKNCPD